MKPSNLSHITLIGGSTVLSGILNYLYHPIMLRYMSVSDFGIFASLLSVTNILSIFVMGISFFLTREFSRLLDDTSRVYGLYRASLKSMALVGVAMLGLYLILSPGIGHYLRIESWWVVAITGIVLLITSLGVVPTALFRSLKRFRFLGFIQSFNPFLKLIIGFGLVYSGFAVYGAILGLTFAGGLTVLLALWYVERVFHRVKPHEDERFVSLIMKEKKGVIAYILGTVIFTIYMNADVILAKNIFAPVMAGIYASVAVLAKFLVFLFLSLETVYYGQIMEQKVENIHPKRIIEPLFLIVLFTLLSNIGASFIGEYVLGFLKPELALERDLFLLLILFSAILSVISFVSKVLIGWEVRGVVPVLALGAIAMIALVYFIVHTTLISFVMTMMMPLFVVMLVLLGLLVRVMRR